jgi:hypothetical protein
VLHRALSPASGVQLVLDVHHKGEQPVDDLIDLGSIALIVMSKMPNAFLAAIATRDSPSGRRCRVARAMSMLRQ